MGSVRVQPRTGTDRMVLTNALRQSIMEKTELNKSEGKIYQVICPNCKNKTRHKVIASVDTNGRIDFDFDEWVGWQISHQIIECQGCSGVSFRIQNSDSETHYDERGPDYEELLYPKRTTESWNAKSFPNLPYDLRRIYRETVDCYNNENLTLCGAGVRALVEGLCKANGIIEHQIDVPKPDGTTKKKWVFRNLEDKINELHNRGKMTKGSADILHEHRFLGNKALHELSLPAKEELSLALEIIESVFDSLYEIPEKASELKRRRLKDK
jgi:hypothetical protein